MPEQSETIDFLEAVWGEIPAGLFLLVWSLDGKKSEWFTDLDKAAKFAAGKTDFYMGVGLSPSNNGPLKRCEADKVAAIAGMWADIDIAGPAHRKLELPPSEEDARKLVSQMTLEPSLVVHSGNGLQAWWLLKEPLVFSGHDERTRAMTTAQRWHFTLRTKAKHFGWDCDSTSDLARVLRLPGTTNSGIKDEKKLADSKPVRLLTVDGPRYADLEDFENVLLDECYLHSGESYDSIDLGELVLNINAVPPFDKFEALNQNDDRFRKTWARKRTDLKDQSASGYEMAISNALAAANWTPQEILDSLVCWRRRNNEDPKIDRKKPIERYVRAIRKAVSQHQAERQTETALEEIGQSLTQTKTLASASDERQTILDGLSKILGVKVTGWLQHGTEHPLYSLQIRDGEEILIGNEKQAISFTHFKAKIYSITHQIMRVTEKQWPRIANALGSIVTFVEDEESKRRRTLFSWVDSYLEQSTVIEEERWSEAITAKLPFQKDGLICVHVDDLRRYIITNVFEKIDAPSLREMLRHAGFRRKQFTARENGKSRGRSYWVIEFSALYDQGDEGAS